VTLILFITSPRIKGKDKGKAHSVTWHKDPEGKYMCIYTLSLTSAVDAGGWSTHAPAALPPGKLRVTQCTGVWLGPSAGLDGCGKLRPPPPRIRFPDRPARSEALYRLSYAGPQF
jgi:hypothetical protein